MFDDRLVIQLRREEKKRLHHIRIDANAKSWRELLMLLADLYEACRNHYHEDDPRKIVERLKTGWVLVD